MTIEGCQVGDRFNDVRFSLPIHADKCGHSRCELDIHLRVGAIVRQAECLNPHGQPVSRTGMRRYRYSST